MRKDESSGIRERSYDDGVCLPKKRERRAKFVRVDMTKENWIRLFWRI